VTATVTELVESEGKATIRLTITGGRAEITSAMRESPHLGDEVELEGELHINAGPESPALLAHRRSTGGSTHVG
jgi:hypothetical protein